MSTSPTSCEYCSRPCAACTVRVRTYLLICLFVCIHRCRSRHDVSSVANIYFALAALSLALIYICRKKLTLAGHIMTEACKGVHENGGMFVTLLSAYGVYLAYLGKPITKRTGRDLPPPPALLPPLEECGLDPEIPHLTRVLLYPVRVHLPTRIKIVHRLDGGGLHRSSRRQRSHPTDRVHTYHGALDLRCAAFRSVPVRVDHDGLQPCPPCHRGRHDRHLVFPFQPGALCHALQSVVAAEEPHFSPAFLFKGYALTALCASPTLSRTATPPHPHTPPNIFPPLHTPPHTLHVAPPHTRSACSLPGGKPRARRRYSSSSAPSPPASAPSRSARWLRPW